VAAHRVGEDAAHLLWETRKRARIADREQLRHLRRLTDGEEVDEDYRHGLN
jgi:hypothetical protein